MMGVIWQHLGNISVQSHGADYFSTIQEQLDNSLWVGVDGRRSVLIRQHLGHKVESIMQQQQGGRNLQSSSKQLSVAECDKLGTSS